MTGGPTAPCGRSAAQGRPLPPYAVALLFCLLVLTTLPGCGGCWNWKWNPWRAKTEEEILQEQEERAKREEEKKKRKDDFVTGPLVSYPDVSQLSEQRPSRDARPEPCRYKPGHWTATTLAAKTNNFDFVGELEIGVVDQDGRPMGLPGMGYTWTGWRSIALPKGQVKLLEGTLYVPPPGSGANVDCAINAQKGGHRVPGVAGPLHHLSRMPPYQYHLAVLARWPERYAYVKSLDSVRAPFNLKEDNPGNAYYHVRLLEPGGQGPLRRDLPLPGQSLFWTSIAGVIWDDVEPDVLSLDQQKALLDWLHWGGQLILSGPGTLGILANSFLGPYLPATSQGTRPITAEALRPLDEHWTPVDQRSPRHLQPAKPWENGCRWTKHAEAQFVPRTGELVVERRVGCGRIAATAFPLHGLELTGWSGFDSFFNACLLRRPPREFIEWDGQLGAKWVDDQSLDRRYPGGVHQLDARRVSRLRYFTRDAGCDVDPGYVTSTPPGAEAAFYDPYIRGNPTSLTSSKAELGEDVASWKDFNEVAKAARQSLLTAARVEVPGPMFVVWVVSGYLLVLVPLNWLVFRVARRVEWAWVAAPIMAVVCTVVVVRLAQLDIGFARSLTEMAVVEIQGDYPRAHVTRYTAMYTSLATRYDLRMEDPGGQVQPFPNVDAPEKFQFRTGERPSRLEYLHGRDVTLRGFAVPSNNAKLTHSEQMVELGGGIALTEMPSGAAQVANRTGLVLQEAGVIRKVKRKADSGADEDAWEAAWIGTLEPEATARLLFQPVAKGALRSSQPWPSGKPDRLPARSLWEGKRTPASSEPTQARRNRVDLARLFDLAESGDDLAGGEMRLVGWIDARLPGMEVRPAAPQTQSVGLIVAHLRPGLLDEPGRDLRSRNNPRTVAIP